MLDTKIELLRNLPIFQGLAEAQLGLIVDVTTKAFFDVGETLAVKDSAADRALLIMTGRARCIDFPVHAGQSELLGPGTLIGELAMLVDTFHAFTIQAGERVRAMAVPRDGLRFVMEKDPRIALQISDNLILRLRGFARNLRRFDLLLESVENNYPEVRLALK